MGALRPEEFVQRGRAPDGGPVVVCAGDSITEGVHSASWIGLLSEELGSRGYTFVNAGRSGFLSCSLLRDLDAVIDCDPDVVVVMIGTNDVMATMDDAWRRSYLRQEPPEVPTLETYRGWLDAIVGRLRSETTARLALLEIPPISEHLDSVHNQRVDSFNEVVRAVAAAYDLDVLPVNARLADVIAASPDAPAFDGTAKGVRSALLQRHLLRRSWDAISARGGRAVLTDNIHLNDRAAREVAALVRAFVLDRERHEATD